MKWEKASQTSLEQIQAYVAGFRSTKPNFFRYFQGGESPVFPLTLASDRGIALLLLFASLYQNIEESQLVRILSSLWDKYGLDIFRLNRLPFAELQESFGKYTVNVEWAIASKAPGILRSVCDFFFRHGKVIAWVYSQGDGEACVRTLAEEVFMMGKTSELKTKARYFLWMLTQVDGVEVGRFWTPQTRMPITYGHQRFLREFGPLKGAQAVPWETASQKLDFYDSFFRTIAPQSPWEVYTPLDYFMRSQYRASTIGVEPEWLCKKTMGGCQRCALAPECPGRDF